MRRRASWYASRMDTRSTRNKDAGGNAGAGGGGGASGGVGGWVPEGASSTLAACDGPKRLRARSNAAASC